MRYLGLRRTINTLNLFSYNSLSPPQLPSLHPLPNSSHPSVPTINLFHSLLVSFLLPSPSRTPLPTNICVGIWDIEISHPRRDESTDGAGVGYKRCSW